MALQRVTLSSVRDAVNYLSSFRRGNISASRESRGDWVSCGELPDGWRADLKGINGPVFVIYSYQTPIAWTRVSGLRMVESGRVWTVPPTRYSASTTNHQNAVRRFIDELGHVVGNDRPVADVDGA